MSGCVMPNGKQSGLDETQLILVAGKIK